MLILELTKNRVDDFSENFTKLSIL